MWVSECMKISDRCWNINNIHSVGCWQLRCYMSAKVMFWVIKFYNIFRHSVFLAVSFANEVLRIGWILKYCCSRSFFHKIFEFRDYNYLLLQRGNQNQHKITVFLGYPLPQIQWEGIRVNRIGVIRNRIRIRIFCHWYSFLLTEYE